LDIAGGYLSVHRIQPGNIYSSLPYNTLNGAVADNITA